MADYHTTTTTTCTLDLTISVPQHAPNFPSGGGCEGGAGMMRDLDINQAPMLSGEEEDWMMMMMSTAAMEDEEDSTNGGAPPRKKLRLSKEQSRLLEDSFRQHHTLNPRQKEELASELNLKPRQVEVWFQNRRARSKLKQTEMECEYLKRWFGSLTEQNRRLQREVEELRAMKVCPPYSCEPLPGSGARTMCPQCERVTTISADATTPNVGAASTAALFSQAGTQYPLQSRSPSTAC